MLCASKGIKEIRRRYQALGYREPPFFFRNSGISNKPPSLKEEDRRLMPKLESA